MAVINVILIVSIIICIVATVMGFLSGFGRRPGH